MPLYVVAIKSARSLSDGRVAKTAGTRASFLSESISKGIAAEVFPKAHLERSSRSVGGARVLSERKRATGFEHKAIPDAFIFETTTEKAAREVLERLANDPEVAESFVAPPRDVLGSPRETGRVSGGGGKDRNTWGMTAIEINKARRASGFCEASNVVVGIIDSGIDLDHADLVGIGVLYFEDGKIATARDRSGHGTHVSGIIAGVPRVKGGMRGVCRPVFRVYKALDPYSPSVYYRALRDALESCDVLNLSLGGPHDPVEEQLINSYLDSTAVVAAMGNEYEEGNQLSYPAAIKGVIAVGAVDRQLHRGGFSNTGDHIALCAPGVSIWSTVPTYKARLAAQPFYDTWDGTSMAAPFVSGVVALLLAKDVALKPSDILNRLKTRHCNGQSAFSEDFGAGIIDADATLR